MRALVQRVAWAEVQVEGAVVGQAGRGLLVYVAVGAGDVAEQAEWLADKVANLRIFADAQGKLNESVRDVRGDVLAVSNFTLLADAQKGRRPSLAGAASFDAAGPLHEAFVAALRALGVSVSTGVFGVDMAVRSQADGPVNIIIDAPRGGA